MKKFKHLLLIAFLFSIIWSGCSKDFSPFKILHNDNRTEEWISMGLNNKPLGRIRLFDNYLYVCAYDSGLFRINIKKDKSEWEFLDFDKSKNKSGAADVVVLNDSIVVCNDDGIYRSTDAGNLWQHINNIFGSYPELTTIEQSPHNHAILFTCNSQGQIFRSVDFGKTWKEVSYSQFMGGGWTIVFETLRFHPKRINEIWAGSTSNGEYPMLFKTKNSGKTWDMVMEWDQSPEGKYSLDYIFSIAFDPVQDSTIYLGMRKVWKSTDNGSTWEEFFNAYTDSLLKNEVYGVYFGIEVNPTDNKEILISEKRGVYYTSDGGQIWRKYSPAEGAENLEYIAVNWQKRIFFLSTFTKGVYKHYL